jgi:flagella basal body P-ring formation protein FlgA
MIIRVGMRCLLPSLALVLMCQAGARADTRQDFGALRAEATRFVASQAGIAYPGSRATVTVGPIDPRLNLPACPAPAFALASGNRLWGSGNLAVNCAAPSPWSLYLTYQVALKGPALLARRPLAAGTAPGPSDLTTGQVEYAADPGRYPRDPAHLAGAVLTRPVAQGSAITLDQLRAQPAIKAGQRVRVVFQGNGFQVSQEGIAQGQAGVGDNLRLKTPSGRYVQGTVQADGTVRVGP